MYYNSKFVFNLLICYYVQNKSTSFFNVLFLVYNNNNNTNAKTKNKNKNKNNYHNMGEVETLGVLLSKHYLQISDITNTNYWFEDRINNLYQLVLNNFITGTNNTIITTTTTSKSNGINQTRIYLGCVLLERLKQPQEPRDFWNTPFSIVNIHDGKNRILSLYHLLYLLRSMINFEAESEQIRFRYLELDSIHQFTETKSQTIKKQHDINNNCDFTSNSYEMRISDDVNSDCEMDCSFTDFNDSYSSFTSCPRITFEDQSQNNILSTGLRYIMRSRNYRTTTKTTTSIILDSIDTESVHLLSYQRAALRIRNDIISSGIHPSDLWKYMIDKIVFHICYVPTPTSIGNETIVPQFYRNQAFSQSKGVIEMIGMQIIHTDTPLIDPCILSNSLTIFTNTTTTTTITNTNTKYKDNNEYYNDILFWVINNNNIDGNTPESEWKRVLRLLYSSTGLSRNEYSTSSSTQSNMLYIASKFLWSTLGTTRDNSINTDQEFMDLFLIKIPSEIEKLAISPLLSQFGHSTDSLLKNYLINVLLNVVESYLFIEGIVGETDQIAMNTACKLKRFALHPQIKPISFLLKLLNYTKMYYIFTPVLLAFFCNPILSGSTSDNDSSSLSSSPILFDNLNSLVYALLRFWIAQQFVRIYSKIQIEYQSTQTLEYCDVTTQKLRQVLTDFSRQVYTIDVSNIRDIGQKPIVAMKRLVNVINNYIQKIIPKESNIIQRVCCSKTFSFTTWQHTKFLLYLYELQTFGDHFSFDTQSNSCNSSLSIPHTIIDVPDYDKLSVEHILPKSSANVNIINNNTSSGGYYMITLVDRVHKLGNLSIADCKANSHYSNFGYKTKSRYKAPGSFSYANSSLFSLREITNKYPQWNENTIDDRSHSLARYFEKFVYNLTQ